jgi:hypothetical protein
MKSTKCSYEQGAVILRGLVSKRCPSWLLLRPGQYSPVGSKDQLIFCWMGRIHAWKNMDDCQENCSFAHVARNLMPLLDGRLLRRRTKNDSGVYFGTLVTTSGQCDLAVFAQPLDLLGRDKSWPSWLWKWFVPRTVNTRV